MEKLWAIFVVALVFGGLQKSFAAAQQQNSVSEALLKALNNNCSHATIRDLVRQGADVSRVDGLRRTALHLAIDRGCCESIVHTLATARGASPAISVQDGLRRTPLHLAIDRGCSESVILALTRIPGSAAALFLQDTLRRTVLHLAIDRSMSDRVIGALASVPGVSAAMSMKDASGRTPLKLAIARYCSRSVISVLREAAQRSARAVPALRSVRQMASQSVPALAPHSNVEEPEPAPSVSEGDKIIQVTQNLHDGLKYRYSASYIRNKIQEGADVSIVNGRGLTALHVAIENSADEEIFKILLEAPTVEVAMTVVDDLGRTVVHFAIERGKSESILRRLVRAAEASIMNVKDDEGRTVLYRALYNRVSDSILDMLLGIVSSQAVVSSPKRGMPFLHCAVESGCSNDILARLMRWMRPEDLRARDGYTRTALHLAVDRGVPVSTLETLINGGVNPYARKECGWAALDCAKERGDRNMTNFLSRARGWNIVCEDSDISSDKQVDIDKEEQSECPICFESSEEMRNAGHEWVFVCQISDLHKVCSECSRSLRACPLCQGPLRQNG